MIFITFWISSFSSTESGISITAIISISRRDDTLPIDLSSPCRYRFVSPHYSSPILCCLWGWIEWGCLFFFTHLSSQSKNRSSFNRWNSSPVEDSTFNQCPSPAHTHLNLTGSLPNGSTERRPTSIDWIPHTPCVDRRRPTWAVAKRMYRMKINTDHMTQKASLH